MKKFVIDTNVLINDPLAFKKFGANEIIIPLIVVAELDGLKKRMDATGVAARSAARFLDNLREQGGLHNGVRLDSGGILTVTRDMPTPSFEIPGGEVKNDHVILQICLDVPASILVTEDTLMRVMADGLGIHVERYKNAMIKNTSLYEEARELEVPKSVIDDLYSHGNGWDKNLNEPEANEYMSVKSWEGTALARFFGDRLIRLNPEREVHRIRPRNKEQVFLVDALTDKNIDLVVAAGPAGSGKTLLSLAAGLEQVDDGQYKQVVTARPTIPLGRDIGYLPGSIEEKMAPWMMPIHDAMDVIVPSPDKRKMSSMEYYQEVGKLDVQPLSYIRGRSLPNKFLIVDEAQNLSKHEIKTIITRAGKGTKVVLTGDPYQIDSPYLDQFNNALSYVIDNFKGQSCFAYVYLHRGERSDLAELAAELL